MNQGLVDQIVAATLYEGYILYPYRPSSSKNRRERFTFGRVYPEVYSRAQKGAERCVVQTECLVQLTGAEAALDVTVRFLHPVAREIGVLDEPISAWNGQELKYRILPELRVGDDLFLTWHEAMEREARVEAVKFGASAAREIRFCAAREIEPLRENGQILGVAIRHYETLKGWVNVALVPMSESLAKVIVSVVNQSPVPDAKLEDSDAVLPYLFASTHIILHASNAEFISQIDPPPHLKDASGGCENIGVWPVLVGSEGERDTILASPIILYDYPQIAPESAGPLFDGTEIDELLTLRIQTMTDQEKLEMRSVDEHARKLLERTEALPNESLLRMHGRLQEAPSGTGEAIELDEFFGAVNTPLNGALAGGVFIQPGDRVRVRPKVRADIIDIALQGQTAIVEAVEQDVEERVHVAVVFENDPGKDLGMMRQPGHRFFFGIDEVEPLVKERQ